ncbi:hypothetical protein GOP47_0022678 [Adiantum capillus-veneris]|uniref:Phytocyanin domain-containing protein n=2 Tax=Adiantum capillus-veneris TaxID=13818 RepID=A0A9D4Z5K0_ADICA|nr:hypothetical protein GOP47_0022678 [Adiantum capillus-veneris]
MRSSTMVLMMVMVAVSLCAGKAVLAATTYKVGDDAGWAIMSYDSWVAGKTFLEGDILEFVYGSNHDVVEVNAANYQSCAAGSNTVFTDGDTKYTLSGVGMKYYICTVSTHCNQGMKVSINVVAAAATTPTTSPTTPTTPNTTTPTTPSSPTTNTTTPSSPTNSSPLFLPPSIFTLFLILGLTLFFFHSS